MSGGVSPNHSAESLSCVRYSDRWERSLIRGADSANCFKTTHVSSSRHTPTTDRGSLLEKLSRGGVLSASRIDIGFISYSVRAGDCRCCHVLTPGSFRAPSCQRMERSRTYSDLQGEPVAVCPIGPGQRGAALPVPTAPNGCGSGSVSETDAPVW